MTSFADLRDQVPRPAPRVVELPPEAFADDWDRKPSEAMRVGLRLVSEGDVDRARSMALRKAIEVVPEPGDDRVDAFNDCLMRNVLARATCMPDDARESFFPLPEADIEMALTEAAVKKLWIELDALKVESSAYLGEADDDQLALLASLLVDAEPWKLLPASKQKRLRRLCLHLLDELEPDEFE